MKVTAFIDGAARGNPGPAGAGAYFVAGEEPIRQVTMAKLMTQRASFDVMDTCLQLHGGAGYMREYGIERAWGAALVLIVIVMALNLLARVLGKVFAPKSGR